MLGLRSDIGGYTRAVPKRAGVPLASQPAWQRRISVAVKPHGQLAEIARAAEMTSPQLQKIANGTTRNPGVVTLARIAKAMGITLLALLDETRPDTGDPGRAQQIPSAGSSDLERIRQAAIAAQNEPGWRSDIATAIVLLGRALKAVDQEAAERDSGPPGRGAAADR